MNKALLIITFTMSLLPVTHAADEQKRTAKNDGEKKTENPCHDRTGDHICIVTYRPCVGIEPKTVRLKFGDRLYYQQWVKKKCVNSWYRCPPQ